MSTLEIRSRVQGVRSFRVQSEYEGPDITSIWSNKGLRSYEGPVRVYDPVRVDGPMRVQSENEDLVRVMSQSGHEGSVRI